MGKRFDMPEHDGQCGHCSTQVPTEATVCTGCGARWGTSSGEEIQDLYDQGRGVILLGIIFLLIGIAVMLWMHFSFGARLETALALGGTLTAIITIPIFIKGIMQKHTAKNAKVSWWRKI